MAQEILIDQVFLKKLAFILENNFKNEQFGVKELAENIGMSRSQLHRKLITVKGKSTSQVIREYRLKKALEMLQGDNVTASEVAYKVGFNSPTYFNTSFREFYGYTPGEVKYKNLDASLDKEPADSIEPVHSQIENKRSAKEKAFVISTFLVLIISALSFYFYTDATNNSIIATKKTDKKSIAILPFKNLSDDKSNQYFADGLMNAVLNRLSDIEDLKVISGITMKQYQNSAKSAPLIAQEVGVNYLIQGSAQKNNDSIKINIHLIDAKKDEQIWSKYFERNYSNIFDLESEIARLIASELKGTISPMDIKQIEKTPTKNLEAYNLFLKAEYQKNKYNKISFNNAVPLYENAIALDSNFVEAYVGLSEIWVTRGIVWGLYDQQSAWVKAKEYIRKAERIDSTNKQIEQFLLMGYFYYEWKFPLIEKYSKNNLLDLDCDFSVDYLRKTGRYKEALTKIETFIEINPSIGYYYCFKAEVLMLLDRKKEAISLLDNNNSLYNDNFYYLRESAKIYFYLEEFDTSRNQLKKLRNNFPDDNPPILIWLDAVLAQKNGEIEKSKLYLNQLIHRYQTNNSGSPAWFIALYYCYKKDYENTFIWLNKSYDRQEVEMTWLREDPLLIPLHDDARYKDLYRKIGFPNIN